MWISISRLIWGQSILEKVNRHHLLQPDIHDLTDNKLQLIFIYCSWVSSGGNMEPFPPQKFAFWFVFCRQAIPSTHDTIATFKIEPSRPYPSTKTIFFILTVILIVLTRHKLTKRSQWGLSFVDLASDCTFVFIQIDMIHIIVKGFWGLWRS